MDKIIQLSNATSGQALSFSNILIFHHERSYLKLCYAGNLEVEVSGLKDIDVLGDQLAIELILKNLLENTKFHAEDSAVNIQVVAEDESVQINYSDGGILVTLQSLENFFIQTIRPEARELDFTR